MMTVEYVGPPASATDYKFLVFIGLSDPDADRRHRRRDQSLVPAPMLRVRSSGCYWW